METGDVLLSPLFPVQILVFKKPSFLFLFCHVEKPEPPRTPTLIFPYFRRVYVLLVESEKYFKLYMIGYYNVESKTFLLAATKAKPSPNNKDVHVTLNGGSFIFLLYRLFYNSGTSKPNSLTH